MGDYLQDAIQRAAALAKAVPENLQEAAFNRALDQLLGVGATVFAPQASAGKSRERAPDHSPLGLANRIDRTKHSDVGATDRVADRALKILDLAQNHYNVDGLTAQEIAEILTQEFRLGVSTNAVNIALQRETDTVNVKRDGGRVVFHLMAPGEDYLKRLRKGEFVGVRRSRATPAARAAVGTTKEPRTARNEGPAKRDVKSDAKPVARKDAESPRRKASTSRPGPKVAVERLITGGFFDSLRSIGTIQAQLKDKKGLTYSLQELSPTLIRLLRDEQLVRERNAAGQYEYKRA